MAIADELVSTARELPRIDAGLKVADTQSQRWNRVVLLARPRISSGDVDALPAAVRKSVSEFVLTIMAAVDESIDPSTGQPRFRLVDIGVGYSTQVNGELQTVTVSDAAKIGVNLGLFSRLMLTENEKQLKTAKIIARTSTLMIIDTPAYVLRGTEHHEYVMRHFVWIDANTGRNAALVWLVDRDATGKPIVEAAEPPRWAPAGLEEDRAIHVDGREFNLLGIPNQKAFALENLPPGKPVPWSEAAKAIAAAPNYSVDSLRQLSGALNEMLQNYARP